MFVNSKKKKRKIPEVNSSASADVAFLLLIFFLLTTSMDKTQGIFRRLSPAISSGVQLKKEDILKRNLLTVSITSDNQLLIEGEPTELSSLGSRVKEFVENPQDQEDLPEKITRNIILLGDIAVTQHHVIAFRIDSNSDYETYISILNELIKSYDELRNEFAEKRFNKPYKLLSLEQKEAVRQVYPQKISEIVGSASVVKERRARHD